MRAATVTGTGVKFWGEWAQWQSIAGSPREQETIFPSEVSQNKEKGDQPLFTAISY